MTATPTFHLPENPIPMFPAPTMAPQMPAHRPSLEEQIEAELAPRRAPVAQLHTTPSISDLASAMVQILHGAESNQMPAPLEVTVHAHSDENSHLLSVQVDADIETFRRWARWIGGSILCDEWPDGTVLVQATGQINGIRIQVFTVLKVVPIGTADHLADQPEDDQEPRDLAATPTTRAQLDLDELDCDLRRHH